MREHFKDNLEPSYQLVVGAWSKNRGLTAPEVQGAVTEIVESQTVDATRFLTGHVADPREAAVKVVSDWWLWALEDGGGFDSYDRGLPFVPWAISVLWFKSLAYRIRQFGGRRRMEILADDVAGTEPIPVESVEQNEESAVVNEEVDSLSRNMKTAIVSKYWNGESSRTAAIKHGGKPADFDRWRFRALTALEKKLAPYMRGDRRHVAEARRFAKAPKAKTRGGREVPAVDASGTKRNGGEGA